MKALWFFEREGKEKDLACRVLAMADWAGEYNELSNHPLPAIPPELQIPYSSPRHGGGGAVPTGPYSERVQFYGCSYPVPGPVDVSVCDFTIL